MSIPLQQRSPSSELVARGLVRELITCPPGVEPAGLVVLDALTAQFGFAAVAAWLAVFDGVPAVVGTVLGAAYDLHVQAGEEDFVEAVNATRAEWPAGVGTHLPASPVTHRDLAALAELTQRALARGDLAGAAHSATAILDLFGCAATALGLDDEAALVRGVHAQRSRLLCNRSAALVEQMSFA